MCIHGYAGGHYRKHSHRRHHSNTGSLEKDEVSGKLSSYVIS